MSGIATGTVIGGKFRIDALIGKGGMGEVYAATHTLLGRQVAVKVLPSDFIKELPRVRRFFREAKIAASLVHDHICEVTDVGEAEGGVPFLGACRKKIHRLQNREAPCLHPTRYGHMQPACTHILWGTFRAPCDFSLRC